MTLPAHIASGYLLSKACYLSNINCFNNPTFTAVLIVGALLPDVDGMFGAQIKDHRNTPFHAPLFWLVIFISTYTVNTVMLKNSQLNTYLIALNIGIFSHLFLDWLAGRTAGIRIFYPFSKKVYSLFPLNPEKGAVGMFSLKNQAAFWKYYLENKFLVITEMLVILSPLAFLV